MQRYMAQGGAKVAVAAANAPARPDTFHPMSPIIRIMFGPGIACAMAKMLVKS